MIHYVIMSNDEENLASTHLSVPIGALSDREITSNNSRKEKCIRLSVFDFQRCSCWRMCVSARLSSRSPGQQELRGQFNTCCCRTFVRSP